MNIADLLLKQVTERPDTPAIIDTYRGARRVTTFAQLAHASAQAVTLFKRQGLQPGDAVLVFQPMSAELYITLGAIFRLGLVAMFVDPAQGRDYLERCVALFPPKALLAGAKAHLLRLVSPALRSIPRKFVIGWPAPGAVPWQEIDYQRPDDYIFPARPDTPALITFTSGSTGWPKAAMRTHGFLLAQYQTLTENLALRPGWVDLATLPIVALANLAAGITCVIPAGDLRFPGRLEPGPVATQIVAERVSRTVASPALLAQVTRYCLARQITLPGLKQIYTGGGPVFPRLLDQMQRVAPQAEITAVYGSTEAEPIAKVSYRQIRPADFEAMLHGGGLLAGPPVGTINVQIVPDRWGTPLGPFTEPEFQALGCSTGQAGEIVVSGDHVLSGYLHGQGDAETKFCVGNQIWHRTGDAGYLDSEGRLWLLGRCAARLEDGRGILYPFAVECALSFHPQVRRSALVAHQGRRILAVELYDGGRNFSPASITAALPWANLDEVRQFNRLPVDKRHNAKIDYPALQKFFLKIQY